MSSRSSFRYISPSELAELVKSEKQPMKDYVVVDVRDEDFIGGNIIGCVRAPWLEYPTTVDGLVTRAKDVPKMIFHCMMSQERGPRAAKAYAETRNNRLSPGETSEQEIYVLRGGFSEFQRHFRDDPALVEKWDVKVWQAYGAAG